jgi:hypothetical protein
MRRTGSASAQGYGATSAGILPLSPAAAAVADYRAHGCKKFKEHVRDHLANGYLFSTPSLFVMAKAVEIRDPRCAIRDNPDPRTPDPASRIAWYITYARGDLRILRSLVPFPLPYIAFRRHRHGRERLRVYSFDRFFNLATCRAVALRAGGSRIPDRASRIPSHLVSRIPHHASRIP